jgi:hypothetical protein
MRDGDGSHQLAGFVLMLLSTPVDVHRSDRSTDRKATAHGDRDTSRRSRGVGSSVCRVWRIAHVLARDAASCQNERVSSENSRQFNELDGGELIIGDGRIVAYIP